MPFNASAEKLYASLAQMPVHALTPEQGVQVNLVKAIGKAIDKPIDIQLYSFARSVDNVISHQADFHIPLIKNDIIPEIDLPYNFSTETIFTVNFVLYSQKRSAVTLKNLAQFNIETDRAHINYFPFKVNPSDSIENSLTRVHRGMIDGYIFADTSTDPLLKKLQFKNIRRALYKVFEVKMIVSKDDHGHYINSLLTEAIQKLKKSGALAKIEQRVDIPYDNWQP